MSNKLIEDLRESYDFNGLTRAGLAENPYDQFHDWFEQAKTIGVTEPNAMTLATTGKNGQAHARTILLKGVLGNEGFIFYSNYESAKAKELIQNPKATMLFCWLNNARQIRIEGAIIKQDKATSQKYFNSRPRGSQLGAWVSQQSSIIPNRKILEDKMEEVIERFKGIDAIPMPDNWGGYVLQANLFEFWQGQENRLHDRFQYKLSDNSWEINRLAP